jgi:hypothetical protein
LSLLILFSGNNNEKKKDSKQSQAKVSSTDKKKGKKEKASSVVKPLSLNKTTVEILDNASPDVTPRDETDDAVGELFKSKRENDSNEQVYRTLNFSSEQSRIKRGFDKYLTATFVSKEDIEKERNRLYQIEESSKESLRKLRNERSSRLEYLKEDRSAIKIQRLYRGHLGRRKVSLIYSIKNILKSDDPNDWIEVHDKETGDLWYYNKITNESQWNKPLVLDHHHQQQLKYSSSLPSLAGKSSKKANKDILSTSSLEVGNIHQSQGKTLEVSMSLPSFEAMKSATNVPLNNNTGHFTDIHQSTPSKKLFSKSLNETRIQRDLDKELGISKLVKKESLTGPDGSFKPQLRNVVMDALLDTRFDSVATVLADTRWFEKNEEVLPNLSVKREIEKEKVPIIESRIDLSRPALVSVLTFNKRKMKKPSMVPIVNEAGLNHSFLSEGEDGEGGMATVPMSASDLTLNNIAHTGFENPFNSQTMCFGCWSAGFNKNCSMHESKNKIKTSETMLLCRNWDLDVMKRRYRSEEIQEIFMKKESSLRYNSKYHRFYTVIEQKHPIYRMTSQLLERFNTRLTLFNKIKYWLQSLADEFRQGKVHPSSIAQARLMRIKRGLIHLKKIERFSTTNRHLLPIAPITGYSWPERCNEIQYLYKYFDKVLKEEVDIIRIEPIPVPKKLYEPKQFHLMTPQTIPLIPSSSLLRAGHSSATSSEQQTLPANTFISDTHPAAWLEKMCSSIVRDKIEIAFMQITSLTPITSIDLKVKTKRPSPNTLKYATLGSKPLPQMMAVGGLPLEMLVYLVVSTYFPPQYGDFMVMDKSTVSPGVSPEVTIAFESILMPPTIEPYIERPLEHPLSYRRPPTITINSNASPDNKHFYGINRPEQTGEQESHGFRTTTWSPMLLTDPYVDPSVFIPGQTVVSLNTVKANNSYTTHADHTYPFCEPSTRDNSTLDFYHLLLTGIVSLTKPQVFTALTIQEPGDFQKNYRIDFPLGHLVVSVYRSWSFTQQDTIQEFKTDDGISYWYHRKTGQTFWERPLYEVEEKSVLEGGTILDTDHLEEPTMMTKGAEGNLLRRYSQGDFRKTMLNHVETKKDAANRRKAAATTVKNARQRGVLPEPVGFASVINNANNSQMFGDQYGSKIDFTHSLETSLDAHPSSSGFNGTNNYPQQQHQQQTPMSAGNHPSSNALVISSNNNVNSRPLTTSQYLGSSNADDGSWMPNNTNMMNNTFPSQQQQYQPQQQQYSQQILPQQTPSFYQSNASYTATFTPSQQGYRNTPQTPFPQQSPLMAGGGFDTNVINSLSQTLGQLFTNMMNLDRSNPQDMLQLGMGMGMALMNTGAVQNIAQSQIPTNAYHQSSLHHDGDSRSGEGHEQGGYQPFPNAPGGGMLGGIAEELSLTLHDSQSTAGSQQDGFNQSANYPFQLPTTGNQRYGGEPIGQPYPTIDFSTDKALLHHEEIQQRHDVAKRFETPLNTLEIARGLKIEKDPGITPDELPPKVLTHEKHSNAEDELRDLHSLPVIAYPELSTQVPGGAPDAYKMKPPAGLGISYVSKDEEQSQLKVTGNPNLRRTVLPLPVGFFDAITAKHVAKQAADYLPQVPNLPQSRTIGRVKPRSAASDWLMISFDPWSAGKNPLGTEFVPSLMAKADKLLGTVGGGSSSAAQAVEQMESLRQSTIADAYVNVMDEEGLAQQKADISKAQVMASDFKKLCSLCRHSKFSEAEQLINQPDWAVPIDYQDDQGNALIHVAAQNGSKRLVKLCLRRGANLNVQNLNGQTALHFAYGYGYSDVGDYLVGKGADDSIRNKDSLTCYEGLGARELALL